MLELAALSIAPITIGVIAQTYFKQIGALWAAVALWAALYTLDALTAGALRQAWSQPNLFEAAKSALATVQANDAPTWRKILFIFGWSAVASLAMLLVVATLPRRGDR